ncbi:hypothetical protein PbJCM13498_02700 [Prolixibacter bellariivorans]|uniref:Beta-galactosidase n=2 Tax=Prolixibacter bellariivorans TaxID=314319 RepID=A0A5M4AVG4_9BACT|nr:hypothetical protein [Prolixibacter bellariivorans]GET31407.1 hypothetical protein PbJCM13498_02700 [Prolixibacter bellariivorans]
MKKIITIQWIVLLIFVGSLKASAAAFGPMEQSLNGMWKFRIGDNMDWASPNYDDSGWNLIKAPARWENQGYNGYDGYAWYRISPIISASMKNQSVILEMGYIDDADEVYFNGTLIGKTGAFPPHFATAYTALRKYQVPAELIRFGEKNVIAVRVYDAQLDGGIIAGNLKIYSTGFLPRFDINLAGKWQFNKGRSYSESRARPIHVPGAWENQGYFGYDGYAVYAKKIEVSNELASQRLVLLAGRIDDADKLYINGKYIGQTGQFGEYNGNIYREFRNYFLPPNTLEPGENLIEIKVYDSGGDGGIYEGPVGIMTQKKFREYWKAKRRN